MGRQFALFLALLAVSFYTILAAPSTARVVGGYNANVGQFPHQISLQRSDSSHTCGGSILSERWALTAAHCVVSGNGIEPFPAKFFQIRVGSIQRLMGGEIRKIKRIIVNKTYGDLLNDVALLELERPLEWTDNIKPIEMATEDVASGSDVIISGWGQTDNLINTLPYRLQWNTLTALSTEECQEDISFIDDSVICLSSPVDNGVCFGDSGGPAIHNGKLVGIAGFVVGGCGTNYPDGYAKVAYHRDWILENMQS